MSLMASGVKNMTTDIQATIEYLSAIPHKDGYCYLDAATHQYWVSSVEDITDLARRLDAEFESGGTDMANVYLLWCAETDARWVRFA